MNNPRSRLLARKMHEERMVELQKLKDAAVRELVYAIEGVIKNAVLLNATPLANPRWVMDNEDRNLLTFSLAAYKKIVASEEEERNR